MVVNILNAKKEGEASGKSKFSLFQFRAVENCISITFIIQIYWLRPREI